MIQLRSGRLVNETNFRMSIDLGKKKEGITSFFNTSYPTTPQQAAAVMKMVKDKNFIWVTLDEPYKDYDQTVTESTMFKTTVVRLNLSTGSVEIKAFFEAQQYPFTSAMLNGNLYRYVANYRALRIDQFNFETGKLVKSAALKTGKEPGADSVYARIGGRCRTEKDVKGAMIIKRVFGSLLIIDSLSSAEQLLTVGHYGDHYMNLIGVGSVAGLIMTTASLIVGEFVEGSVSTVYYYFKGSMETGFTATYQSPFVRKVIDDYEYRQLRKRVKYDYRGYLYQPGLVYAIYQKDKSKSIQVMTFRK